MPQVTTTELIVSVHAICHNSSAFLFIQLESTLW